MKVIPSKWIDDESNSQLIMATHYGTWICSIPFSVDDLSGSFHEKDFSDVKPAADLLENPAFQFLQD
jgi:myosin-5